MTSVKCKKCGQRVKTGDMLEHIILVHNDHNTAKLVTILSALDGSGK